MYVSLFRFFVDLDLLWKALNCRQFKLAGGSDGHRLTRMEELDGGRSLLRDLLAGRARSCDQMRSSCAGHGNMNAKSVNGHTW